MIVGVNWDRKGPFGGLHLLPPFLLPLLLLTTTISSTSLRDMGTHGSPPARVPEVPIKWTQPARSPTDLQVGPETLSTTLATLEDLGRPHPDSGRPAGLVAQASPLYRGAAPPVGPRIAGSPWKETFLICNRPR
jgi:hypothetical protein